MLDSHEIQTLRIIIRSLLKDLNISYRIQPLDGELYRECIGEAMRRGYPIGDGQPLRGYLQDSVKFAANAYRYCTNHRANQIWLAHYLAAGLYIDDIPSRFPSEMPNLYSFNDRFVERQEHGNAILDTFADVIRQAPNLFPPVVSNLITSSTLDFITATLLECEMASVEISDAARQYPTYQRSMSGSALTFAFMVFPREIPLKEYIQAIPEVVQFINELNDVLSFYKEEIAGETTNLVSIIANRNKESKLRTLKRMAESVTDVYGSIFKILKRSPDACNAFKRFTIGYIDFHFAVRRYKLADLALWTAHRL